MRLALILLLGLAGPLQGAVNPLGTVAIGDSPFALALAAGNQQAVVVNLFPVAADNSNVRVINVANAASPTPLRAFRAGTRLVSIAVTGSTALVVNEDQDVIRVLDVNSGTEVAQIPVGSRPSSVIVSGTNQAIAANGTSGDLSIIDISGRRVVGNPIPVGKDPRAAAVHPGGRYMYVALGGDNAVAVVDLQASPQRVIRTVAVGKNPVSVVVTPDGQRMVVANLTNNTVTILSTANPAAPAVQANVPVGVQPTALATNPANPSFVYVANLGSPFFSAVDITRTAADALRGVVQMNTQSSGLAISSDGTRLFVTEFKNAANLRIYDLTTLNNNLDPRPVIDIPGEPRITEFLTASGVCSFYIAEATLLAGQKEGFWGMEVALSAEPRELTGGFNLGGGFEANGGLPGFGAFSLSSAQRVTFTVNGQQLPGTTGTIGLVVDVLSGSTRVGGASGAPPLNFGVDLQPGFYVVQIRSTPGSPRGTFQMGLEANSFNGGVVVGGFITAGLTGFGAFCVPISQPVTVRLVGRSEYSGLDAAGVPVAAGDLVLTIRDANRNVIRTVNNAISSAAPVAPPAAPAVPTNIRWYVDASVTVSGNGSSTSPFKSLTAAMGAAQAGEVIFVRAGRYSPSRTGERIPMDGWRANVQIVGAGAATTIIDAENNPGTGGNANAVVLANSGIRFAGFTVRGAAQVGVFVFQGSNVVIENVLATSNTRFGIGSLNARGLIVRNNVAVSNLESGIAISGSTGLAVSGAPTNCPASPSGQYGAWIINNNATDNRADGVLISQGGNVCVANNVANNNGSSGIEFNNRDSQVALNGVIVNNDLTNNGGVQFGFAGTGILVTENNANADIIDGNKLLNNRPFGIGIFLQGKAGRISNNTVTATPQQGILVQRSSTASEITGNTVRDCGLSGLFVENQATVGLIGGNSSTNNGTGLSILDRSSVSTVASNHLDRNGVGMEVAGNSRGDFVQDNTFDSNSLTSTSGAGVFVREGSSMTGFLNNKVRANRGQGGILVSGSTFSIGAGTEISGNLATGLSLYLASTGTVTGATISGNAGEGGIFLNGASQLTLTNTSITGNIKQGIIALDANTVARLNGGVTVSGTTRASDNSGGFGLNAQSGASITCSGSNTFSNNAAGNSFGSVTGCN